LTTPQREHHAHQAGPRTQRHALVTACQPGVPRRDPGHPQTRVTRASRSCTGYLAASGSTPRPPRPIGADRLASTHSPSLGDGSYGSGRALQALTSRFDSGLLHRVRGRR